MWRDNKSRTSQCGETTSLGHHNAVSQAGRLHEQREGVVAYKITCSILKPEEGECSSFLLASNKMVVE